MRPRETSTRSLNGVTDRASTASVASTDEDDSEETELFDPEEGLSPTAERTDRTDVSEHTVTMQELAEKGCHNYCCHWRHHTEARAAGLAVRMGCCVAFLALPTYSFTAKFFIFGIQESEAANYMTMYEEMRGGNETEAAVTESHVCRPRDKDCRIDVTVNNTGSLPLVSCPANSLFWEPIQWHVVDERGNTVPVERAERVDNCTGFDHITSGCVDLESTGIWCGAIPAQYNMYWWNICQMVVFTVALDFGTTVQYAWQGISGIYLAIINRFILTFIFREGAQGPLCTEEKIAAADGSCRVLAKDARYSELVCLIDVLVVIILFLASRAQDNTIKFGLSWHAFLMMEFMNPEKGAFHGYWQMPGTAWLGVSVDIDSSSSMVFVTALFGCIASVMLLLPRRTYALCEDISIITEEMSQVWVDSIEYLCGLHGSVGSASKYSLATRIAWVMKEHAALERKASQSWWGTFDWGKGGAVQRLAQAYTRDTAEALDILEAMRRCLLSQDLSTRPVNFGNRVRRPLHAIGNSARSIRKKSAKLISLRQQGKTRFQQEAASLSKKLNKEVASLVGQREAVLEAACKASPSPSPNSIPVQLIYPFLAASWATGMAACAKRLDNTASKEESQSRTARRSFARRFASGCQVRMFTSIQFYYILRNTTSIFVCYVIGMHFGFDSTMAGTLSLLLIRAPGRVVDRNIQRLLGVALASTLPNCIIGALNACPYTPCGTYLRTWAQGLSLWAFVSIFAYISYSDTQWSFPASLIAGIGVVPFMQTCPSFFQTEAYTAFLANRQIVLALLIQMVVDTAIMWGHTPPVVAEKRLRNLAELLLDRYSRLFASDRSAVTSESLAALEDHLAAYKVLLPSLDPKTGLIHRKGAIFHFHCHENAIECMSNLLNNLKLMSIAISERESDTQVAAEDAVYATWLAGVMSVPEAQPALESIQGFMGTVISALLKILQTHGNRLECTEEITKLEEFEVDAPSLQDLFRYLEGLEGTSYDRRCRLAMVAWSLQDAVDVLTSAREHILCLINGPTSQPGILQR